MKDMSLEELWQLFPIILKEHNPNYKIWYEEERIDILNALHEHNVCRINHIGSTAVEGLIAKPTVDILLELTDEYEMNSVTNLLQNSGWTEMTRNDAKRTVDLNKGYTPNGFAEKVYHLHVKPSGDWDELYFRDYLRKNVDIAKQYEMLKLKLEKMYKHNRDAYTNAKSEFVAMYSKKAREEFDGRYVPIKRGRGRGAQ